MKYYQHSSVYYNASVSANTIQSHKPLHKEHARLFTHPLSHLLYLSVKMFSPSVEHDFEWKSQ